MKKKQQWIAAILAAFLFFVITWQLAALLIPVRTQYGSEWEGYLQEPENSIDVLFFGSSLVYCDVIPAVLWEENQTSSYVLAGPEQTIPTSYYSVREACKTQDPQLIVLEATGMFYPQYTNYTKANIGYMPFGANRLKATLFAAEPEEQFGLLFPLYNYHYRWQDVTLQEIKTHLFPDPSMLAGYTLLYGVFPSPESTLRDYTADSDTYRENLGYVEKLRDFCREQNCELLLYIAPSYGKIPPEAVSTLREDMDQLGISLVDFNETLADMNIDDTTDWFDYLHFNVYGAEKFTRHLASYLEQRYPLSSSASAALWQQRSEHLQSALAQ